MLILDSNTISYNFRGDPVVVPRLQALAPADVGVPTIVEYKLRYGLLRLPPEAADPRLAALSTFLRPMQVLPFYSEWRLTPPGSVRRLRLRAPPSVRTIP